MEIVLLIGVNVFFTSATSQIGMAMAENMEPVSLYFPLDLEERVNYSINLKW